MNSDNLFIAFEGIDGSGKSTQIKMLADWLSERGHRVYVTCEPTNNPIGRMIRDIFQHRMDADQRVIAALFVADRLHHLLDKQEGVIQKLNDGYTVLTDRYYLSSYAYHSVHNIDMEWVIQANSLSAGLLRPHAHVYLDIQPQESMARIQKGRETIEMYETIDNQRNVYEQYQKAFERLKGEETILRIDASQAPERVHEEIVREINELLTK